MKKTTLNVEGMSCGHCVKAITDAVGGLSGVSKVLVDLAAKTVMVEYNATECSLDKITFEIEEQGFEVLKA